MILQFGFWVDAQETETRVSKKDLHIMCLCAALFTMVKRRRCPKCPLRKGWRGSHLWRVETQPSREGTCDLLKGLNLEVIGLSEVNRKQKDRYCVLQFCRMLEAVRFVRKGNKAVADKDIHHLESPIKSTALVVYLTNLPFIHPPIHPYSVHFIYLPNYIFINLYRSDSYTEWGRDREDLLYIDSFPTRLPAGVVLI